MLPCTLAGQSFGRYGRAQVGTRPYPDRPNSKVGRARDSSSRQNLTFGAVVNSLKPAETLAS